MKVLLAGCNLDSGIISELGRNAARELTPETISAA